MFAHFVVLCSLSNIVKVMVSFSLFLYGSSGVDPENAIRGVLKTFLVIKVFHKGPPRGGSNCFSGGLYQYF